MPARAALAARRLAAARHRRPGTAVRAKGQRRTEDILAAATAILTDHGYAQLTMRKIAARAGIQPGNLQYYYRTKQDVVRALLERYLDRSTAAVEHRTANAGGGAGTVLDTALGLLLAEQDSSANCRFFWELWALAARDPIVARAARAFYDGYVARVAAALRGTPPRLSSAVARRRAQVLVAMLEGLTVFRLGPDARGRLDPRLVRELRAVARHLTQEAPA